MTKSQYQYLHAAYRRARQREDHRAQIAACRILPQLAETTSPFDWQLNALFLRNRYACALNTRRMGGAPVSPVKLQTLGRWAFYATLAAWESP